VKPIRVRKTPLLALLALLAAGPVLLGGSTPAHLELQKSAPTDGATVESISEIRLWFTDAPMNMGPRTVVIRVLDASGKTLSTGNGVKDSKDPRVYSLALPRGLEPRAYKVGWETMASDGDAVKGQFGFTVAANQER
jgi:methionine-rich copper-binding protein CopC